MEINIHEILAKHQKLVAEKHKLVNPNGNGSKTLVMEHKKSYFDESSLNAIKEIIEAVLLEASNSAEIVELKISDGFVNNTVIKVDKESITSVINKVKF